MILLGVLNFMSLKHYEKSIRYIKDSSINQLSLIRGIEFNSGNSYIFLLHNLYATEPEKKIQYAHKVHEFTKSNDSLFIKLSELIKRDKSRDSLDVVIKWRSLYIDKINKALVISWQEQDVLPFNYEEKEIRPLADIYKQKLQNLSLLVVQNAEQDIANTLEKISDNRILSRLIVVFGILFLLIVSLFMMKISKKLSEDYLSLKLETTGREKAQKELQLLNEELETKVGERTVELKKAYKNILQYNDELKELTKAKDQFISVISHDLRNPIAIISSSSEILRDMLEEEDAKEGIKNLADIIQRSCKKLINQLSDLVDWAKLKSKKIFDPTKLNLHEASLEFLELIQSNAQEKNIQLINEIPENLYVLADKLMLQSIFQNLITNSIKFTPNKGLVTINAVEKNEMIAISIKDTGVGMSDSVRENLFKEISVISKSGTAKEIGTGLGLVLVKDFVNKHGGQITVASEQGKGSTFIFTIPKAE